MKVTPERHAKAMELLGSQYPRTLMQAMQYAVELLSQDADQEPMAAAELEEITQAYWLYLNVSLGLNPEDPAFTDQELNERYSAVWSFACKQQDADRLAEIRSNLEK